MTIQIETPPRTQPRLVPPIQGSARWTAAVLLTAGAVLQVVEFLLEPASSYASADRIVWWADNPTQIALSQAAGILALPFLLGSFWTMAKLTRQHARRTTTVAVSMLTCGMVGLAVVHGVEMAANWLVRDGKDQAALSVLEVTSPGAGGIATFVLFIIGAMIGCIVLLVAQLRSPYVPRLAPLFLLTFMVLDFAGGLGVAGHVAGLASGAVLAWAVVTGYTRPPRSRKSERAHSEA